ncbi:hypothetical protein [Roseibium sp. RKSG952]|uniref:hypothetical protein n=1 Tax=Roseibium sp. RKSG952 TaxID=2529384 RepID=UPI0012BBA151|nr:hypothetical protein [Roseibium sp. RKSG952]MTH94689.1 hypothetical protein [Roseibium sp. RKSG952]
MKLWHGGRRLHWPVEIRPASADRAQAGPGFYLTNRYERACQYSRGGGTTYIVDFKKDITLSSDVSIPVDEVLRFMDGVSRIPNRKALRKDLEFNIITGDRHKEIIAEHVINLFVNHDACRGKAYVELAEFMTEQGADASIQRISAREEWLVVHNPRVVSNIAPVRAADVNLEERELPLPSEFLADKALTPGM